MSCGKSALLGKVNDKINEAIDEINADITEAEAGVTESLDELASKINSKVGEVTGKVKEFLPKIELPEIPGLDEGLLELPDLPKPPAKLQDLMGKIQKYARTDPLKALGEIEILKEKFPDVDIEGLGRKLINGDIGADDICKLIPNVEEDEDGEVVEKGTPTTAASEDAEEKIEVPEIPDPQELIDKADEVKEKLQFKDIIGKINDAIQEVEDEITQVAANLPLDLVTFADDVVNEINSATQDVVNEINSATQDVVNEINSATQEDEDAPTAVS